MITDLFAGDPAVVGPYKLLKRLGQGGMGVVFLARSPGGRQVAVKVIRPEYANEPGFRTRFTREVGAARNVSGMFTALVVDADTEGEVPWLATAYVPGHSLAEAVETQGPLPPASVLQLAAGLAEGLQAIHAAGVVHRDLKPSNVLLAADGPRVIDFGISKAREASMLTQTGMVMGSPGFLSPEQAEGLEVGPPTDIFSLGGVLTYAATGVGPFGSGPTPALMFRVVSRDPDLSRVPESVRPLIERCLAKDPAARPTPEQMLTELDELGAGVGVVTPEWLPESITSSLARYSATVQTPATPVTPARPAAGAAATPPPGSTRVEQSAEPAADARDLDTIGMALGLAGGATPVPSGPVMPVMPVTPVIPGPPVPPGPPVSSGMGGPTGPTGPNPVPAPRPRDRRRLLIAAAAALVLIAGLAIGFGLSGNSQHHPTGLGTASSVVVRATTSASASPSPSPSPSVRPSHPRRTRRPKPRRTGIKGHKSPTAAPSTSPAYAATPAGDNTPDNQNDTTPTPSPTSPTPTPSKPKPAPKPSPKPTPTPSKSKLPAQTASSASASDYGCSPEPSGSGGSSVQFTFYNSSSSDITLSKYTKSESLIGEGTVAPGSADTVTTDTGDSWLVHGAVSGCLGDWIVEAGGSLTVSNA